MPKLPFEILAVWWCLGADGRGIRYARLRWT
jgi:hypothetical protein